MKIKRLCSAVGFSMLISGCVQDSKDSPPESSTPQFMVACDSSETEKLTGCWVSTMCEEFDSSLHVGTSSTGNYIKESFSISSENGSITSSIEFYSDNVCENSVGKAELIDHANVVYGDVFTNSNGLEVKQFKIAVGDIGKVSYFYLNGSQACFPEESFMLHSLPRSNADQFDKQDRAIDFEQCFEYRDKI